VYIVYQYFSSHPREHSVPVHCDSVHFNLKYQYTFIQFTVYRLIFIPSALVTGVSKCLWMMFGELTMYRYYVKDPAPRLERAAKGDGEKGDPHADIHEPVPDGRPGAQGQAVPRGQREGVHGKALRPDCLLIVYQCTRGL